MDVLGQMMGEADAVFGARRSTYDEEISNTNMKEFIKAITGGGVVVEEANKPSVLTMLTAVNAGRDKVGQVQEEEVDVVKLPEPTIVAKKQKTKQGIVNIAAPNWRPQPSDK
jgi:hypothetical protein